MKFKVRFIFILMSLMARKDLVKKYGKDFFGRFYKNAWTKLNQLLKETPDIGDSIFGLNYNYGPCYFAWYDSFRKSGIPVDEARQNIWLINEDLVKPVPKFILHLFAKNMYLGVFREKAVEAEQRGKNGLLHPFDWRITYVDVSPSTFGINIHECGMLKLADKFGYRELFPTVCRMDYLFSHYFDNGFVRHGTLADGDACCDCLYQYPGTCEWSPEKGFEERK